MGALLEAGSASLSLNAALGSGFAALVAIAGNPCPAGVGSLADGSEDEEQGHVESEDYCEKRDVGNVLFER
jgi:hypothetical protein